MAKKHQFTKKNALAVKTFFAAGLPLALAVCIFSGCATKPKTPSGTLTITGIPAAYEGKLIESSFIPPQTGFIKTIITKMPVADGKVSLPLNWPNFFGGKGDGYAGSDTLDVDIALRDEDKPNSPQQGFLFSSVPFEGGVAEVQWADAAKLGIFITATGIPKEYEGKKAGIDVGVNFILLPGIQFSNDAAFKKIEDGVARTIEMKREGNRAPLLSDLNDKKTIWLYLEGKTVRKKSPLGVEMDVVEYDRFLFKDVQIRNGQATLRFADGVQQK